MDKVTADPKYQRQVSIKAAIYLILALVLIQWGIPAIRRYLMHTNPSLAFLFLEILIFLILILMIINWMIVLRVGYQSIQQRQYPPKDVPVLRDMIILRDKKAAVRGGILVGLSFLAIAAAIYVCITLAAVVFESF